MTLRSGIFAAALLGAVGSVSPALQAQTFGDGVAAYATGRYDQAIEIWGALARDGDADAAYRLGLLHELGRGVDANPAAAADWYRRSADAGHGAAAHALANLLAEGKGVEKDALAALDWYRRAAEAGHARAQFHLGRLYLEGILVEKDAATAYSWFAKAAEKAGEAGLRAEAVAARDATQSFATDPSEGAEPAGESPKKVASGAP
ncbi:MAG: sel1 repeat family protein [Sphingomonadales bacterium]|nr:sel1 repeat family protein [Sphingomonadales bacterium]